MMVMPIPRPVAAAPVMMTPAPVAMMVMAGEQRGARSVAVREISMMATMMPAHVMPSRVTAHVVASLMPPGVTAHVMTAATVCMMATTMVSAAVMGVMPAAVVAAVSAVVGGQRHVRHRKNAERQRSGPDQNFFHELLLPLTMYLFSAKKFDAG
jgi:hypothetical protein